MSTRDIHSQKIQRKQSLIPFTSIDDLNFPWLRNVFLEHFEDWLDSIE